VKKFVMKIKTWWKSVPEPVPAKTPMVIGDCVLNLDEQTQQRHASAWFPRQRLQTRFR
jgi:hypothetical protein